jgi:hypothetical protein
MGHTQRSPPTPQPRTNLSRTRRRCKLQRTLPLPHLPIGAKCPYCHIGHKCEDRTPPCPLWTRCTSQSSSSLSEINSSAIMPHLATLAYTAPYGNRQYVRQHVLPTASTRVQTDNQYPSDSLTCDNVVSLASSKHYISNPRPNPTNVTSVGGLNMVQPRVHVATRVPANNQAIRLTTDAIHTETGPATIKTPTVLPNTDNLIPGGTWWFRCYTRQPFHLDRTPLNSFVYPPATHTPRRIYVDLWTTKLLRQLRRSPSGS